MQFLNINWYIALTFCLFFFIGGRQLAEVPGGTPRNRRTLGLILFVFALPALLFPLAYIPGAVAALPWYNTFRAIDKIELFSALIAPAAGYATYRKTGAQHKNYNAPAPVLRVIKPLAFPFCILLVSVNFIHPLIKPLSRDTKFDDVWVDNGVLLQSSGHSSGPASLVSAMHSLNGFADSEIDAAKGTYTDQAGTEFWYLARYAVNHGYRIKFAKPSELKDIPAPSIIPVMAPSGHGSVAGKGLASLLDGVFGQGGAVGQGGVNGQGGADAQPGGGYERTGTYIALLKNPADGPIIVGDPIVGRMNVSTSEFLDIYGSPDLVLTLSAPRNR